MNMDRFSVIIRRAGKRLAFMLALACLAATLLAPSALAAPAEVTVTVKQELASAAEADGRQRSAQTVDGPAFEYQLTPASPSNPMPQGTANGVYTFSIAGNADFAIGPLTFPRPGKYGYAIRHVSAPRPGYTYDQTIYTLEIYAKNDGTYSVVAIKDGIGKQSGVEYRHSYEDRTSDPALMVDPPVVKTVIGTPRTPETFTFQLAAGDPSNPMPAGAKDGVKTLQIKGSGSGEFGTWIYTKPGIYFYTVSEVNTGSRDYDYDATVYTIADTVESVNGQLALTRVVTNGANRQVTSLSFINVYAGGRDWPLIPLIPIIPIIPSIISSRPGRSTHPEEPATPAQPGTPAQPAKPLRSGPKTGDDSQESLLMAIFCAGSAAALASAGYLFIDRRNRLRGALARQIG